MANIGYARCSTLAQDLTAQRQALAALGVPADRVYLDKGLTGTSRARPGLDQALAAVREGDTLTVTKLDRLARSVPGALDILSQLSHRGVRFALGGSVAVYARGGADTTHDVDFTVSNSTPARLQLRRVRLPARRGRGAV